MEYPIVDLVIIGGGPAGLYATFYGGLRDLTITVLEAQAELGGKINFYPEKFVWDIGALPATKGSDVRANLIRQAKTFGATFFTNTKAVNITKEAEIFSVVDEHGNRHLCRSVLLAVGGGIVSPKKLQVPIDTAVHSHIHYAFPDYRAIKNKRIVISGGGDAAVDYANECLKVTDEVFILYRGHTLKAHEASVNAFKKNGGQLLLNTGLQAIRRGSSHAMDLMLHDQTTLATEYLLVQHGHDRDSSFLDQLDFPFEKEQDFYLSCAEPTCTSVPGFFAAGDIQFSKGKLYLLAGAFQDAASSINQIKQYLDPKSYAYAMVSSHNHKFDQLNQAMIN